LESESLNVQLAADLDGTFERLVLAYQERIYRFALRMVGSREDAEEIAQDCFVRAFQALQRYDQDRIESLALRPWLYTIAVNQVRNRARRRRVTLLSLGGSESAGEGMEIASSEPQPDLFSERQETATLLAQAIIELPPRYRIAVVLRHIEGLSYREMSVALEQPVGTVKANVHRGVQRLRTTLSPVEHESLLVE
jgi:RNA polymerase sigma-70 factor, ECF subfamily